MALLQQLKKEFPWHPGLTLKLHDLLIQEADRQEPVGEDVAVLLYSWNNAPGLEKTLDRLLGTRMGDVIIGILNNGSTDGTAHVIDRFMQRSPCPVFHVDLPVNIGAPAARNWLLSSCELQGCMWAAFLDDSVILPDHWLERFVGAAKQDRDATVFGCRGRQDGPPYRIGSTEVNLLTPSADDELRMVTSGESMPDLGMQVYARPCLSVSGCCHFVHLEHIRKMGGFDIRFSPTQFDDFDCDFRNALQGNHCRYLGDLVVKHSETSGLGSAGSRARAGNVRGNLVKLESKYDASQKMRVLEANRNILWDDLIMKARIVERA